MDRAEAKRLLEERLKKDEYIIYTERSDIWDKNKLYSRGVNTEFVLNKVKQCKKKKNYHSEYSLEADDNKAHIFIKDRWYIKYCVIDGVVNIISVHKVERND